MRRPIATGGTLRGVGPFVRETQNGWLLLLPAFMGTVAKRAIVEFSDDAVIGKTLDGIITLWNAGAERLYGYKAHEVIGWPIALIIPRELDAELPMILDRIARGEHPDRADR